MTRREFNHLLDGVNALSPEQMRQLRSMLDRKLAGWENPSADADEELAMGILPAQRHTRPGGQATTRAKDGSAERLRRRLDSKLLRNVRAI